MSDAASQPVFTAGHVNPGVVTDGGEHIVAPRAYTALAPQEDPSDFDAFLAHAALVDTHIGRASELAEAVAAMLNRAHALGAGTLGGGLGTHVADALELVTEETLAQACQPSWLAVTRVDPGHADSLRVFADDETITGTADAWTIAARVRIDTDCGESNRQVMISGCMLPGRIELTSVVAA